MHTSSDCPTLTLCELDDASADGVESYSPFCLKVHRALRYAGLAFERRHGDRPGAFARFNPVGQVPVLLVGNEPVADSTAIVARIDTLGGRRLIPSEPVARAEALLWEEFADTSLNGFLVAARWADDRNWPRVRDAYFAKMPSWVRAIVPRMLRRRVVGGLVARDVWRAGADACWARFDGLLAALDARAPSDGFWLGASVTVADVAIFGQLASLRTRLTPWQAGRVDAHARLARYLDRVDEATRAGARLAIVAAA